MFNGFFVLIALLSIVPGTALLIILLYLKLDLDFKEKINYHKRTPLPTAEKRSSFSSLIGMISARSGSPAKAKLMISAKLFFSSLENE